MEIFREFCCSPPLGTIGEGMFVSASSFAELSCMRLSIVCPLRGLKKWLFVVGVSGGREWEGELGVGGVVVVAKTACRVFA